MTDVPGMGNLCGVHGSVMSKINWQPYCQENWTASWELSFYGHAINTHKSSN